MRKSIFVEIPTDSSGNGHTIAVREVTLGEAMEMPAKFKAATTEAHIRALVAECIGLWTDTTLATFVTLAPSELKLLWRGFKEVNGDFFDLARELGLTEFVTGILPALRMELLNFMLNSSGAATAPAAGSTD